MLKMNNQVLKIFNSILFAVFVSFVCGYEIGEIVYGNDTIFSYPQFKDECIDGCGTDGVCMSIQGYWRYCSNKVGYSWSGHMCAGPCKPRTRKVVGENYKDYLCEKQCFQPPIPGNYYCNVVTQWGQQSDFCSLHKRRSKFHKSIEGNTCKSSCQKVLWPSEYKDESICSLGVKGSKVLYDWCSENERVTYKGEICSSPCRQSILTKHHFCFATYILVGLCGPVTYVPTTNRT